MVDLVLAGRAPDDLAHEFEPTGQSIRAWVAKAGQKEGRQGDAAVALAAPERDELARLRRENKQLRLERDILSKAAAWFARETGTLPSGSSGSGAQTRPHSLLLQWRACSACRRLASMRGGAARRPHMPRLTRCC